MEISVVLSVFNGEKYLRELMNSILSQKDVIISEFIIVDDCSTDNSGIILKEYASLNSKISIIKNQENQGVNYSFKKGAGLCTSDFIAFADQDDIWKENKLSLSLQEIKKLEVNSKPCLVFTNLEMMDESGSSLGISFWDLYKINPSENSFFTILFANIATGCTMVINKLMKDEFLFMPLEAYMYDQWLLFIASSLGDWSFVSEPTIFYRVHKKSVTNKVKPSRWESLSYYLRIFFDKNAEFLKIDLLQAVLFKNLYMDKLPEIHRKEIDFFMRLKNSMGIQRVLFSKLRFKPFFYRFAIKS